MLIWLDQPAAYSTATILQRWTSFRVGATVTSAVAPRASAKSISVGGTDFNIRKTFGSDGGPTPSGSTAILGTNFRVSMVNVLGVFAIEQSASPQVSLRLNSDGTFSVVRGSTSGTVLGTSVASMLSGIFYNVVLKVVIHSSTGTVDLYLDGVSILSLTGLNTQALGSAVWNGISLGVSSSAFSGTTHYWSDTVVQDGVDGTTQGQRIAFNTPLLNRKVEYLPAVAGNGANADSTPSTGSDRGANVDESGPDGDTTYNTLTADGDKDTYGLTDLTGTVNVDAVAPLYSVTKEDAGFRQVQPVFRIGGTDYLKTAIEAPSHGSYSMLHELVTASPDTAGAFTQAEVNAMEVGLGIPA